MFSEFPQGKIQEIRPRPVVLILGKTVLDCLSSNSFPSSRNVMDSVQHIYVFLRLRALSTHHPNLFYRSPLQHTASVLMFKNFELSLDRVVE